MLLWIRGSAFLDPSRADPIESVHDDDASITRRLMSPGGSQFPLSLSQLTLWQAAPACATNNIGFTRRLRGSVDKTALRSALSELVRRHQPLRAAFQSLDDAALQVFMPPSEPELELLDISSVAERDRVRQAGQLASEAQSRPFDLSNGPLLRALLVSLEETDHLLTLAVHHLAADGHSLQILDAELLILLAAFSAKQRSPLRALPWEYSDFLLMEHRRRTARSAEDSAWWRGAMRGKPRILGVPVDHFPTGGALEGAKRFALSAEVSSQLREAAGAYRVSLAMLLRAMFALTLGRFARVTQVVQRFDFSARTRRELKPMVGQLSRIYVLSGCRKMRW